MQRAITQGSKRLLIPTPAPRPQSRGPGRGRQDADSCRPLELVPLGVGQGERHDAVAGGGCGTTSIQRKPNRIASFPRTRPIPLATAPIQQSIVPRKIDIGLQSRNANRIVGTVQQTRMKHISQSSRGGAASALNKCPVTPPPQP